MTDIRSYLAAHPDATITEVAFACGLSIAEARVAMAVPQSTGPSETAHDAPQVSERTHVPSDSDTPVLGHPKRLEKPGDRLDATWLHRMLRKAGVMDLNAASKYLEIARPSIELAVAKGTLTCVRVGSSERGKKLFTKHDLDAYRARFPRDHHPKGRSSV